MDLTKQIRGYGVLSEINNTEWLFVSRANDFCYNLPVTLLAKASDLLNKVDKDGTKVLSDNNFTNILKNKLDGIAAEATRNSTDAHLLARANHTGLQAIATITGLQDALDAKGSKLTLDNHLAGVNPHGVTKAQVGLGNCDNTSDLNKPLSVAMTNALNLKVNSSMFYTSGVEDGFTLLWDASNNRFTTGIQVVPASEYGLNTPYDSVTIDSPGTGVTIRGSMLRMTGLNMGELYGCPVMIIDGRWLMQYTVNVKFSPGFSDRIRLIVDMSGTETAFGGWQYVSSGISNGYSMSGFLLMSAGDYADIMIETESQTGAVTFNSIEYLLTPVSRVE